MAPRPKRRGEGGLSRETQVSKKLSWLLRHGAEKDGLKLGPGGYASLRDVLASRTVRSLKITISEIAEVVADNDKQRFSLIPVPSATLMEPSTTEAPGMSNVEPSFALSDIRNDTDPSGFLIRANQGHSIKVDNEGLLIKLTQDDGENLPKLVVHGTTRRAWPSIVSAGGLKPMTRNHVHFATGLPAGFKSLEGEAVSTTDSGPADVAVTEAPVMSGMRNSSSVLIYIDLQKAMELGLEFWRSDNGVILSDGGASKLIPIGCFDRVEERGESSGILVQNGKVLKDLSGRSGKGRS